ncbi:hypothetical protein C5L14_23740 [Labrys okinawensis]|uniref:Uncharacterized protein n=1 Tax=Labrys okinawensis TaxID=346911 RepID=A0A2S9Q6J5_9HYPH|nr:hypothetical protein C5L14_23740 [Labrys okinawensis]
MPHTIATDQGPATKIFIDTRGEVSVKEFSSAFDGHQIAMTREHAKAFPMCRAGSMLYDAKAFCYFPESPRIAKTRRNKELRARANKRSHVNALCSSAGRMCGTAD